MALPSSTRESEPRSSAVFDILAPACSALLWVALGIFLHLRYFTVGDIDLETDFFGDLVLAARHLAEGRFSALDYPWKGPLYSFALVAMRGIAGDWHIGAAVLSAVSGGVYLVLVYRLALRLFDRRVAVTTMILASLVVEFFVQSHRASTDVFFLMLSLASMLLVVTAKTAWQQHALAGALAALAFLTRYNGAFLVGGTALVLALVNPAGLGRRDRMKFFGFYLGAFLLVCTPWFTASWAETGHFLWTRNVENIISTYFGGSRWTEVLEAENRSLLGVIVRHPTHFATRFVRNLIEHPMKDLEILLGWPLALVPILGILGFAVRVPTRRQTAFYVFALVYWFFMGIVFYQPRFFLPLVLPYLAVGCALVQGGGENVTALGRRIRRSFGGRTRTRMARLLLLVSVVAMVAVQVQRIVTIERTIHARRPLYVLEAARFLASQETESPARVMARKGHVAYYAGLDYSPYSTQVGSLEELLLHARSEGVDYIVYSEVEYSLLPRMLFMAVMDTIPRLEEVYRGQSIRIFRAPEHDVVPLSATERFELLRMNLQAARSQDRPASVYTAYMDLGTHLQRVDELERASLCFENAIEAALQMEDGVEAVRSRAVARHLLAMTLLELGEAERALALLEKNLEYYEADGGKRDVARTRALLERTQEARDLRGPPRR